MQIADYQWPTAVTFEETLKVTRAAVKDYGDIIPILEATKLLDYNFGSAAAIPGRVYKRLDEMTMFGLLERDRVNKGLRATDLGKQAFADYEVEANQAKVKAVRGIAIIDKAYTEWKGKIPGDTAFASELAKLTDRPRTEVEKAVDSLKRLISECFPILQSPGQPAPLTTSPHRNTVASTGRREIALVDTPASKTGEGEQYGELRTTLGSVNITNETTLGVAERILQAFREYYSQLQTTSQKKDKKQPGE